MCSGYISGNRTEVTIKFKHVLWLKFTVQTCIVLTVVANKSIIIKDETGHTCHQESLWFSVKLSWGRGGGSSASGAQ